MQISWPIARQPVLPWQRFCAPLVGGRPNVSPLVWSNRTTRYWVKPYTLCAFFVTLTLDLLTVESCHVMTLRWPIHVPSLNWIWLTVPELERLNFPLTASLKSQFLHLGGGKGVQISSVIFMTPKKALPLPERRIMTYSTSECVHRCGLWLWRRDQKGQQLSCVKLDICPDHPRRHSPLKFCMRGSVREVVIYFKFHENRSRGLGAVEGRKSASPIDKAHGLYNSLYYRTSRDMMQ